MYRFYLHLDKFVIICEQRCTRYTYRSRSVIINSCLFSTRVFDWQNWRGYLSVDNLNCRWIRFFQLNRVLKRPCQPRKFGNLHVGEKRKYIVWWPAGVGSKWKTEIVLNTYKTRVNSRSFLISFVLTLPFQSPPPLTNTSYVWIIDRRSVRHTWNAL